MKIDHVHTASTGTRYITISDADGCTATIRSSSHAFSESRRNESPWDFNLFRLPGESEEDALEKCLERVHARRNGQKMPSKWIKPEKILEEYGIDFTRLANLTWYKRESAVRRAVLRESVEKAIKSYGGGNDD